jgi:hypothetical protein
MIYINSQKHNTKCKLLKCNVNIYYNKQCLKDDLIPKFADIKNTKREMLKCNSNIYYNKLCLKDHLMPKFADIKSKMLKMKSIMKAFNHIEVIDLSPNRGHYTELGLHMNGLGKDWLTHKAADAINKMLTRQKSASTSLEWKESFEERRQSETAGDKQNDFELGQHEVCTPRLSAREFEWFFMVNPIEEKFELNEKGHE